MASGVIGVKNANVIVPIQSFTRRTKEIDISSYITGITVARAVAMFYADSTGIWRMAFNISGTTASAGSATIDLTDIVKFKNTANFQQAVSVSVGDSPYVGYGFAAPNSDQIVVGCSAANQTVWRTSGDVELDTKPSIADANMENQPDISAYLPFGQAGSPGEVKTDYANGPTIGSSWTEVCTFDLEKGTWAITATKYGATAGYLVLSTTINSDSGYERATNYVYGPNSITLGPIIVSPTTTTTYYINCNMDSSAQVWVRGNAIRLA